MLGKFPPKLAPTIFSEGDSSFFKWWVTSEGMKWIAYYMYILR